MRSSIWTPAVAALGLFAVASPCGAEPIRRVVPYSGHLDSDGLPFDGEVQMTFSLYDAAQGPQAAGAPWVECHPQVAVHAGAFTVPSERRWPRTPEETLCATAGENSPRRTSLRSGNCSKSTRPRRAPACAASSVSGKPDLRRTLQAEPEAADRRVRLC